MKETVLFIFLFYSTVVGQRASFFKEDVTFRLNGIHLNVEGYYWFTNYNNEDVNSSIFYPFPNYSNEKIDSILVFNLSVGNKTDFVNEGKHGISFYISIPPGDTSLFQICYRQKLAADSAVYILETTRGWCKPLSQAEFKLIVPDTLEIKKFSYPSDKEYKINDMRIYYWNMEDFMPRKDMVFYF